MKYHKGGPACGRIPYDLASSEADCECPLYMNPDGQEEGNQKNEGKTEDLPVSDAERISFRCDTAQNERRISIPPLQVRRELSGG